MSKINYIDIEKDDREKNPHQTFKMDYTKSNTSSLVEQTSSPDYTKKLQQKIKKNWKPKKYQKNLKAIALFSINKKGEIIELKLKQSSSNKGFDKEALKTIKQSAPFDPLPQDFEGQKVDVQFTFEYRLYQK